MAVAYFAKKLTRALLTIIVVVTLMFAVVRLVPGDPVQAILGDQATAADRAALRSTLHLDRSLPEQYALFMKDIVSGSLGESFRYQRPVTTLIAEVLPQTVILAFWSLLLAWIIAVPLGSFAAVRKNQWPDTAASSFVVMGLAIPHIWLGPMLILIFCVQLRWLPMPGDESAGWSAQILPAVTIGTSFAAVLTKYVRASMIDALDQPHVLAARSRGIPERAIVYKHALRNALIPVATVGAAQLGALLAGAVITEKIFDRAGLGTLLIDSLFNRDIPVVQGCAIVVATVYVVTNLILDLVYMWINPQVRVS
jgi:peptide/nickel transport system permease protein